MMEIYELAERLEQQGVDIPLSLAVILLDIIVDAERHAAMNAKKDIDIDQAEL